ncbi:MAG: hypothetical protein WAV98_00355 [Minisyncoccia bacterium]
MNHLGLKSNTSVAVLGKPMVLLPLDIYEKITKSLGKHGLGILQKVARKTEVVFLATANESSLSKDWLSAPEEKAWKNL